MKITRTPIALAMMFAAVLWSGLPDAQADSDSFDSQDAPVTPQMLRAVRGTSAYANGSALMQQFLEDLVVTNDQDLLRARWPRTFFGTLPAQFGAKSLGELLQKRENAAFAAARTASGYASRSATYKRVFDQMLQGAVGKKVDEDYARLNNWTITKTSLVNAQVAADLASGEGSGGPAGGNSLIDFNNQNTTTRPTVGPVSSGGTTTGGGTPTQTTTNLTSQGTPTEAAPGVSSLNVVDDSASASSVANNGTYRVTGGSPVTGGSTATGGRAPNRRGVQSPALSATKSGTGVSTTEPSADTYAIPEVPSGATKDEETVTKRPVESNSSAAPALTNATAPSSQNFTTAARAAPEKESPTQPREGGRVEKASTLTKARAAETSEAPRVPELAIDGSQLPKEIAFKKLKAKKPAKIAKAKPTKRRAPASR